MELLCQKVQFTKSLKDKRQIDQIFIRSILEQSSAVWSQNITNIFGNELKRVQKVAVKLIGNNYTTYNETLCSLQLETLQEKRFFFYLKIC